MSSSVFSTNQIYFSMPKFASIIDFLWSSSIWDNIFRLN
ncbi:hypothetical protein CP02DC23_1194 [Chlamydia psittaci 02DC23]|nr:hypothetical protein CP02DC23_1194 [Chlamydia psittaci 02DC23]